MLQEFDDNHDLNGGDVDSFGCAKYGRLGGPDFARVANLCPVKVWEMRAALDSWPRKWGGFVDCILQIREEASKPKPPGAAPKKSERYPWENDPDEIKRWAQEVADGKRSIDDVG